ncbi:CotH kinase family protein [Pseudonocardia adelaidensis]|uniref:Uncharacterized protein n=1 Tax=Pseudonocardia adelaidensis TaxID=648754 RepID=A0ABP9P958_9PSEU
MPGNLYEFEKEDLTEDFVDSGRLGFEGFSAFEDGKDLRLAAQTLATAGADGIGLVIDTPQFVRFLAMEILLRHWDGHSNALNNALVYNDVQAVANPGVGDVNLKFIPWGLDQILPRARSFNLYDSSVLAELVVESPSLRHRLQIQLQNYVRFVFGRTSYLNHLRPLLATMEGIVLAAAPSAAEHIASVRRQLRRTRTFDLGLPPEWRTPVLHAILTH